MSKAIFKASNVTKKYGTACALNNISMQVNEGDIYGFIGENGAGKTTLIRILSGLATQSAGEIELFSESEQRKLYLQREKIGSIIESPIIYPDMTAYENLDAHRIICGIPDKSCVNSMLQTVNLAQTGKKKAKNFSLGMRQRLAIGIALLNSPQFLVLDEPVNGLDPTGIVEIRELLKRLNKEQGVTILISSHILSELYQLATCFGFISKGKMVEQLSKEQLDEKCKKHIYLSVDDSAKAVAALETVLHTEKYEVHPNNIIKLYDFLEDRAAVSRVLSEAGVIIEEISLKGDDLESYYISVIGGASNV